mmetsp:Transcript_27377/g.63566  ORF Transcript_27377/g.63566 Transcript_27377/m.63566 type:complete len:161 (+) Transcript_27377:1567-2049(+)
MTHTRSATFTLLPRETTKSQYVLHVGPHTRHQDSRMTFIIFSRAQVVDYRLGDSNVFPCLMGTENNTQPHQETSGHWTNNPDSTEFTKMNTCIVARIGFMRTRGAREYPFAGRIPNKKWNPTTEILFELGGTSKHRIHILHIGDVPSPNVLIKSGATLEH